MLLAVSLAGVSGCRKSGDVEKSELREAGYQMTAADWFRAAGENDVVALKKFATTGFPVDTRDEAGNTALHAAAAAGAVEVATHLLDRKLPVDVRGADERTPLMAAVLADQTDMVRWLLRQGADPALKDREGFKPLMLAVREGRTGSVVELAPYSRSDLDPALLLAALVGRADAIDALTNYGASVYARMEDGRTPLMVAAENGHEAAVKLLLEIGAGRFTTDPDGRTAADLASAAGHSEIVAMLAREPVMEDFSLDSSKEIATAMDELMDHSGEEPDGSFEIGGTASAKPANKGRVASVSIEGETLSRPLAPTATGGDAVAATTQERPDEGFSMPPLVMRSYREKEVPLSVQSVRGETATLAFGGAAGNPVQVQAGDELPGTSLVVVRVQRRMENSKVNPEGAAEISVVAVRDTKTGQTREWISGIAAGAHDPVALVEDSATGRRYIAAPGQHFTDAEGNRYLVSEVRPNQVVIQEVATGDVRTIRLRGPRG